MVEYSFAPNKCLPLLPPPKISVYIHYFFHPPSPYPAFFFAGVDEYDELLLPLPPEAILLLLLLAYEYDDECGTNSSATLGWI